MSLSIDLDEKVLAKSDDGKIDSLNRCYFELPCIGFISKYTAIKDPLHGNPPTQLAGTQSPRLVREQLCVGSLASVPRVLVTIGSAGV